jgi:hypothetical protein
VKLEPEGKNRLEAMKKRLSAGLPLAGMLAAAAVGASTEGCLRTPMGRFPSEPQPEEWVVDGVGPGVAPVGSLPQEEVFVTEGLLIAPEEPEVPEEPETPEDSADGEEAAQP